ncbi:hypothetical protein G9A89_007304 [Geosiphon pyriformis]|nr:hypothetical protein G9A89_007304 [Geosiphon pyriformis]
MPHRAYLLTAKLILSPLWTAASATARKPAFHCKLHTPPSLLSFPYVIKQAATISSLASSHERGEDYETEEYAKFAKKIDVDFTNPSVLTQAVTHRSYKHGTVPTMERLEFLGESVIQLYATEFLLDHEVQENELFERVESYIDPKILGLIGKQLGLNKLLRWTPINLQELQNALALGFVAIPKGETRTTGRALLALVGAIYHDKGASSAQKFILKHVIPRHPTDMRLTLSNIPETTAPKSAGWFLGRSPKPKSAR